MVATAATRKATPNAATSPAWTPWRALTLKTFGPTFVHLAMASAATVAMTQVPARTVARTTQRALADVDDPALPTRCWTA